MSTRAFVPSSNIIQCSLMVFSEQFILPTKANITKSLLSC